MLKKEKKTGIPRQKEKVGSFGKKEGLGFLRNSVFLKKENYWDPEKKLNSAEMEILKEKVNLWKFFKKEKEGLGLGYKEKRVDILEKKEKKSWDS